VACLACFLTMVFCHQDLVLFICLHSLHRLPVSSHHGLVSRVMPRDADRLRTVKWVSVACTEDSLNGSFLIALTSTPIWINSCEYLIKKKANRPIEWSMNFYSLTISNSSACIWLTHRQFNLKYSLLS